MKKYILPFMSIAMLMASCSSSDDEVAEIKEESKLVPMTFTATQESNAGTRSALNSGNKVVWMANDEISVFDGTATEDNRQFTLIGNADDGKFSGEASSEAATFTAVYPYTDGAQLGEEGSVSGIELPATQNATPNSFDPGAALMMAVSTTENKNQLDFKNAISLVKVTPKFSCSKIELAAADGESSAILAGKGTLNWNNGKPTINFTGDTSNKITLIGSILKDNSYYIVVPTGTLNRMWKITFTANDVNNTVYTRYCSKSLTIERNKIINLGEFATNSPFWADVHRGNKVTYEQEVDLGIEIIDGEKTYKVIFANANLTATGLAANVSDFGDYFAWGAIEPWCTAYTRESATKVTPTEWKKDKESGYIESNAPELSKTYNANDVLSTSDDPARHILGGDWQLPTKEIWQALNNTTNYYWEKTTQDGYNGRKVTSITDNTKSIFLPAAGVAQGTTFNYVGSYGNYWSGTVHSSNSAQAFYLSFYFSGSYANAQYGDFRYNGFSVRPVRLVAAN